MAAIATADRVCVFRLAGQQFAIEGRYLRRVIDLNEVTPLPRSSQSIIGVVSDRGVVMILCDLRTLLALENREAIYQQAMIIRLDPVDVAFAVDEVIDFTVPDDTITLEKSGFSYASYHRGDDEVRLLDVDAVLLALEKPYPKY